MLLLIGVNRKGERVYSEFASIDKLEEHLQSHYRKHFSIENRNEPQEELKSRIIKVCRQNSVPDPDSRLIYETEKAGSHLIAYNAKSGVEVVHTFFICEAEEFSSEELCKMTQCTSQTQ